MKRAAAAGGACLPPFARSVAAGLELRLLVVPGSKSEGLVGEHGDRLRLRVSAPPDKGKANEAVCELLEEVLKVRGVALLAGHASREKTVLVPGLKAWPADVPLS